MKTFAAFIFLALIASGAEGKPKKLLAPPHCTQVTKDTDYLSRFRFDYPSVYIVPGQREAHQPLHCIKPAGVNKGVTVVCDWSAPPQVQFSLGDEYVHVIRQDPSGRYVGNAVITTYQLCNHTLLHHDDDDMLSLPFVNPVTL